MSLSKDYLLPFLSNKLKQSRIKPKVRVNVFRSFQAALELTWRRESCILWDRVYVSWQYPCRGLPRDARLTSDADAFAPGWLDCGSEWALPSLGPVSSTWQQLQPCWVSLFETGGYLRVLREIMAPRALTPSTWEILPGPKHRGFHVSLHDPQIGSTAVLPNVQWHQGLGSYYRLIQHSASSLYLLYSSCPTG